MIRTPRPEGIKVNGHADFGSTLQDLIHSNFRMARRFAIKRKHFDEEPIVPGTARDVISCTWKIARCRSKSERAQTSSM